MFLILSSYTLSSAYYSYIYLNFSFSSKDSSLYSYNLFKASLVKIYYSYKSEYRFNSPYLRF